MAYKKWEKSDLAADALAEAIVGIKAMYQVSDVYELCRGCVWMREQVRANPDLTLQEFLTNLQEAIDTGIFNYSWALGFLQHNRGMFPEWRKIVLDSLPDLIMAREICKRGGDIFTKDEILSRKTKLLSMYYNHPNYQRMKDILNG